MAIDWGTKDPDEIIEHAVDFADALDAGDSLLTIDYSFLTQAGLTKTNPRIDGTLARVRISAGTHGGNGRLRLLVTTLGGETLEELVKIKVRNKT